MDDYMTEESIKLPPLPHHLKQLAGDVAYLPDGHIYDYTRQAIKDDRAQRDCTCHPDDDPPVPCPRKYALSDCREAAQRAQPASECYNDQVPDDDALMQLADVYALDVWQKQREGGPEREALAEALKDALAQAYGAGFYDAENK